MLETKGELKGKLTGLQRANEDRSQELAWVRDGTTPMTAKPATTLVVTKSNETVGGCRADIEAEVSQQKAPARKPSTVYWRVEDVLNAALSMIGICRLLLTDTYYA